MLLAIGLASGLASALFLVSLEWVTAQRTAHAWLIALLPLAGFIMGWAFQRWGASIAGGTVQVIAEAQAPQQRLPLRMAPMILLGTLATHLCGGSAGREGTAVQMGAALADQLSRWSQQAFRHRPVLLLAGISGGFGSLFGTPWAAGIFAIEVLAQSGRPWSLVVLCWGTAWIAHGLVLLLGIPHNHYAVAAVPTIDSHGLWATAALAVAAGVVARLFVLTQGTMTTLAARRLPWLPLRLAVGGLIVALAAAALGSTRHLGLGIPLIHAALAAPLPLSDSVIKLLLTAITLGFGFKGGEVTPLFVIGACLGSALAGWLPLPVDVLAALGFVAVFAAAAKTPLACMVMAMELFGPGLGWHAALACALAVAVSGQAGIYRPETRGPSRVIGRATCL